MRAHSALGCEVVAGAVTTRRAAPPGAWDLFFVLFPGLTARANLCGASGAGFFSDNWVMAGASADGDAGSF
jgi:hypothetical protein